MKAANALVLLSLLAGIVACDGSRFSAPDEAHYQPSAVKFDFNFGTNVSFRDYVAQSMAYLRKFRVYYDQFDAEAELQRIAPFELSSPAECESEPTRGVLLIHGISGTAHALRDIGAFLNADCLLVRGILLPGHGTRPGDLLDVTKEEWMEVVDFGVRTLKRDVDHVYVAGFSLGGLLAVQAATEHPDLSGLILLSPALYTNRPVMIWQTRWLRYFTDWIDVDPEVSPVRYHSMPTNGLAELVELRTETIRSTRRNEGIRPAVFAMLTEHDYSIQSEKTLKMLEEISSHEKSRFIYYGSSEEDARDSRTLYRSSYLPQMRVLNFSHVSFPYSPDNPLYGAKGTFKECDDNFGADSAEAATLCAEAGASWKGEFGSTKDKKYLPLQRLTFNPHFDRMKEEILSFMDETAGHSLTFESD